MMQLTGGGALGCQPTPEVETSALPFQTTSTGTSTADAMQVDIAVSAASSPDVVMKVQATLNTPQTSNVTFSSTLPPWYMHPIHGLASEPAAPKRDRTLSGRR
jgi:hypothetical protein